MKISKHGTIELANYEALSHSVYLDSGGVRTIGIGMTSSEIPDLKSWPWDKTLSTEECVRMFQDGLKKYEAVVNKALKVEVLQHQFDALVSITYNIGVGGMAGSTFMKKVNSKADPESIVASMKQWNKDNGKVVRGLINRRNAEAELFLTGNYKNNGTVGLIEVDPINHHPRYKGSIDIEQIVI